MKHRPDKPFYIGSLKIANRLIMAPMAGVTDLPFRLLVKSVADCGLMYSEMISAVALVYGSKSTLSMLDTSKREKPLGVQIFGSDAETMSRAAKIVQDKGADLLDVNFGCSVKKIVKTGAGAALMKNPLLAEKILKSIKKVLRVPLTIKCRSGWKTTGEQALELARIAENCGVDAITIHPRSVSQKFSGSADWSVIAKIKQAVSIPVIGNGDVKQPADAFRMFEETGCDAVMIGRFAVGDPWIFSRIIQLAGNGSCQPVDPDIRFDAMLRYLDHSIRYYGEKRACNMLRGRLGWLSKTLPHNNIFKESIKRISSREEAVSIIEAYKNHFILPESSQEAILP